ncbi:hypothetical protein RE428_10730 [Marinobacter nanhaiticus D15-8W]|nr:hypothetical protein RE428_10730 [Marinobacter nanhaiticus D15-8W]
MLGRVLDSFAEGLLLLLGVSIRSVLEQPNAGFNQRTLESWAGANELAISSAEQHPMNRCTPVPTAVEQDRPAAGG